MFTVFLVIQILVTLALVVLILVQRSDNDGMGSMGGGGGGGNAFMTGRGAANLLTRSTAILATIFMVNSLWLAIMASSGSQGTSLADELAEGDAATVSVPLAEDDVTTAEPIAPEMPVTSTPREDAAEETPEEAAPEAAAETSGAMEQGEEAPAVPTL